MSNFKTIFIKKLSLKKWNMFERDVRSCLKYSCKDYKKTISIDEKNKMVVPSHLDDDYSQAFGIVQGVAYYALGYKGLGADNVEGTPKKWFNDMVEAVGKDAYLTNKKTA